MASVSDHNSLPEQPPPAIDLAEPKLLGNYTVGPQHVVIDISTIRLVEDRRRKAQIRPEASVEVDLQAIANDALTYEPLSRRECRVAYDERQAYWGWLKNSTGCCRAGVRASTRRTRRGGRWSQRRGRSQLLELPTGGQDVEWKHENEHRGSSEGHGESGCLRLQH